MKFKLSKAQKEKLKDWQESIFKIYGSYGTYTYCFTPTGIGDMISVKSHLVGPEFPLDLTEVENW